jgi:hypothetical protein
MLKGSLLEGGKYIMDERIDILREALHQAIANGNEDEILKASVELDIEIVNAMVVVYGHRKVNHN